ncbi:XdhC family protein [Actinophytocola oryzae]|uniref:XdhC-like protein n=1 Tax=Actinophytocola oryzae TaxID=502181 RepID=A0A4R7USU1_9PSEU|nr:XdhC family protein [Actinophytocola oryzae]TDV34896.1 XdhC-like protein [Actinophytocola oryzae]
MATDDASCAVAHGDAPGEKASRTLVAVFASPVADLLLRYGHDLGYRTVLVEPERGRVTNDEQTTAEVLTHFPPLDDDADVVVTDHHRVELGPMLAEALKQPTRWLGVMGNPRHQGPHVAALKELGLPDSEIARVHRPIGLNIGSRTPPEIAMATLAGLVADRNGKPGGFEF